jgi:hypothetical protein
MFSVLPFPVDFQKFHEEEDVTNKVLTRLRAQAAEFCYIGAPNPVPGLNKCLDRGGNYVEK